MSDNTKSTIKGEKKFFVPTLGKKLVLAEKPSVGRDIARVLKCQKKGNMHFESNEYIVTWALGHLVTLATPEKYNQAYDTWTLETLPMIPNPFKLEVIKNTSKQYYHVKKLMERGDVSEIIIATDAGREGELVARWIIDYAKCKKPIKRLWISSVTDQAIKNGFKKLVDGRQYDRLYYAAKARAQADWIVGLNGTRALTCKHNASLSLGRVQTPTLELIAEREAEVRRFKPQNYYELEMNIEGIRCKYSDGKSGQSRIFSKDQAETLLKEIRSQSGTVKSVKRTAKKTSKTGFYDLTELQRDANRLYHFSAKETLNAMQGLYERHKVLTYPRTDSKYITKDIVPTLQERVKVSRNNSNKAVVGEILRKPITGGKHYVNDAKVGDHHGIIPTEETPFINDFSSKEQKIYNLVLQRFFAVLLPAYQYEEIAVEVEIAGCIFRGKGKREIDLGWKKAYGNKSEDDDLASVKGDVKQGVKIDFKNVSLKNGKTAPPNYLTEGELLHQMEKAGLGTVATRGDIIEKILNHQYVEQQGNVLRVTKTGKQLLNLVPEVMKSKEMTAKWEKELEAISKGQKRDETFMKEMIDLTKTIIHEIKIDQQTFKHDNVSTEKCPDCGKKLLIVKNKFGKKLVCSDRECGYKKNVEKATNARCPNCHKKLSLVGEGDNKKFVCKCGYKEKLEAFNKRKKDNNKISKRDAQKYMKKANKEAENFNNPFANLLKDMD